ncbi:cation transporter [Carnobacterium sp. AT7]|uniref:TrkH family potassium uptake protein n=1 Tax=Carnobacterium sp. AT7 TaxID=333990 RepID=UPI00015F1A54|nr:potassium transporter TrkG [Carnobacterium sp. AT7]EDP68247.1 cation transporter [Carnobacterium sp. AT7]
MNIYKFIAQISNRFSTIQLIVLYYFMVVIVASILLVLPIFRDPGADISFIDLIFTAVSTVSVTGLATINLGETFNVAGIILLQCLFMLGSLGVMMISTSFMLIRRKKVSLKQRQLIMTDMNQPKLSGTVRLIRTTILIILGFEFVGGVILSTYFYIFSDWPLKEVLFHGFFTSFSAVANVGVDLTGQMLIPFHNDYFVQLIIMLLIVVGGIGFPVLLEVKDFLQYRRTKKVLPFRFSLFSKITVSSFFILLFGGALCIWLLEYNQFFKGMTFTESAFYSFFYSVTTRNAGLMTTSLGNFSEGTLLLFSILMFIGASPSSVGGGIRTTTLAIVVVYLISFIRGHDQVALFRRRIGRDDVQKSIAVFILSMTLCMISILVLSVSESHELITLIVEVTSAFGTTGLSLGITPTLTVLGKLIIIILMFVGRIGMLYMVMLLVPKHKEDKNYHYPTEKIIIG